MLEHDIRVLHVHWMDVISPCWDCLGLKLLRTYCTVAHTVMKTNTNATMRKEEGVQGYSRSRVSKREHHHMNAQKSLLYWNFDTPLKQFTIPVKVQLNDFQGQFQCCILLHYPSHSQFKLHHYRLPKSQNDQALREIFQRTSSRPSLFLQSVPL